MSDKNSHREVSLTNEVARLRTARQPVAKAFKKAEELAREWSVKLKRING